MARANKWKQFIPQKQQAEENKTSNNLIKFADSFQVSTHDQSYKDGIDIEISEDLIATSPVYLEISVKDQAIKFIVQVTQQNLIKSSQRISVLKNITDLYKVDYDVNMRFQAYFRIVNEQEKTYQLSFVEILVKEHFLSRRDMVQINQKLLKTTCYTKKNIIIQQVDNIKGQIQIAQMMMCDIANQEQAHTGIITEETNIVYRSLESKMAILIEVSQETFQDDAIGEVTLESMQKFLKVFYMRNQLFTCNHKLEIIIYARVYFPKYDTLEHFYKDLLKHNDFQNMYPPHAQLDQFGKVCLDIYKKVPERKPLKQFDQLAQTVIQQIQELTAWMNVKKVSNFHKLFVEDYLKKKPALHQMPSGKLSSSKKSNLLEAIALVTQNFRQDHATRSLRNSGHLILILSPGNGYYFGDLKNYKIAKKNALNNNIVCMLNCFGRIPNITGPMFHLTEYDQPIETGIPYLSIDQKLYFRTHSVYLNQIPNNQTYQDRNKFIEQSKSQNIRHAYWIQIIKYNDEFLRSFYLLYERQNQNDLLPLCFKKQKQISYSQVDFTLLDYYESKPIINATDQDTIIDDLLKINDMRLSDSQLKKIQIGSSIVEEQIKTYTPMLDTSQQVNIFMMPVYEKKQEHSEQVQVEKKPIKNTQKKKLKSHNRTKWKLYQWGWKSHQFIYQMKEQYHRLFKNYLLNHLKESEQNLFLMEQNWKNICFVPLCPLKSVMVYEELQELKTSGVHSFVEGKMKEFEDQVMGIILAENYQHVKPGELTEDEYGSKLQCFKNQAKNVPVKFIKGSHIITVNYDRQTSQYSCEEYYKKKQKAQTLQYRYSNISNGIIIPQLYRYNLHANNGLTCREILLTEQIDTDIKGLINIFSEQKDYTFLDIKKMRPKRIGLSYIPNESLSVQEKQQQYVKWMDNFQKFMDKLKQQLRCFNQDSIKLQHFMKSKQVPPDQFNHFNLKYSIDLPDYKSQLHNEKYESLCITSQVNYCPKCTFNINLSWISSSAIPIIKVIKIMERCSIGFTQVQIPGSIENIFEQHLPFESISKFRLNNKEVMKSLMKDVRYAPYDCFYDKSYRQNLLVHRKGLFFLKFDFDNLEILFKENLLICEEAQNQDQIQLIYQQLEQLINNKTETKQ